MAAKGADSVSHRILNAVLGMKQDVGELKRDVGVLKSDVGELKSDVGELKSDVRDVKAVLETHAGEFEKVHATLNVIGHEVTLNRKALEDHEARIQVLERK